MYNRLATEEELDPFVADETYLQDVVSGAPAPAPAPVAAPAPTPFNPVGFDWTQGVQNIGGTIYQPIYETTGAGEEFQQGPLQQLIRYQEGQTAPGQAYEVIDPATGKPVGTGQFQKTGDFGSLVKQAAADLGPILQFTPLAPIVQGINALSAIQSGNYAQGIGTLAGLGGYTDIANAARLVGAAQSGDPLAALTAGMDLAKIKDIGGFNTKDIAAANAVVQGIQSGDYGRALSGAAQLTDSPNTAVAGAALSFYNAAQSGNPAAMLKAAEALTGTINEQSRYYSKTDTGDETARLQARYGTADDNVIKQIEAMSPTGAPTSATTEDVNRAITEDVLLQSPTKQVAPSGTETVQQAIRDDLNRELADIVYLNADQAGITSQQEAAQQASQRGLPGFIFQGQTYRLSQAPGYLSPEGKLYPNEAAYVATLGPRTITIPGVQIAAPEAGAGRGFTPGMTAAQAAQLPAIGTVTAPEVSGVPTGEFYEGEGAPIAGAGPGAYFASSPVAQLGQSAAKVVPAMGQLYGSGLSGLGARAVEFLTPPIVPAELAATGTEAWTDPKDWMSRRTSSGPATFSDLQQQLKQEQEQILAPLSLNERLAASGGASGLLSLTGALATGGVGGAIALGVSDVANKTWEDGKSRGLDDQTNAMRTAIQAGIEGLGEIAGAKYLGQLIKGLPVTASASEIIQAIQTQGKALLGEVGTEVLTGIAQRAADGVKALGGQEAPITWKDAANEAYNATVQTIFAVGAQGAGHTIANLGTPGQSSFKTETTPVEFLGSTPQTVLSPDEIVQRQLTYQPPAASPSSVQITGPEAGPSAPEIFGPESQLGFEEGVRPTAQQQLEEALSGVYEPPAPPAPAPTAPKDTSGITPEMVAFIDEDGGIVTYGDLGLTAPAPAPVTAKQTVMQAEPATEAVFAEPQMDEINRLFQDIYQQQNFPVTAPAAPTAAPSVAPAQQNVIDIAPSQTLTTSAQDLSAVQQAINQAVYGGTSEERAGSLVAAPSVGTILSTDPAQGTALVVDSQGNTQVVETTPDSKPGDKVDLGAAPSPAPSSTLDLSQQIATDPVTGDPIRLGDVLPSPAPAPSLVSSAPAPSPAPSPAPAPAPSETPAETKTEAPSPVESKTETKTEAPTETKTEVKTEAPASSPAPAETKTEAPAPAETKAEVKTEAPAPAPAPEQVETKTEAPSEVAAPSPATEETKTETPAPAEVAAPAPSEAPVPSPAPAPSAPSEVTAPSPAPTPADTKTEAPASAPTEAPAPADVAAPASAPTESPAPSPAPVEAPAPSPAPTEAPAPSPAPAPAPTQAPAPSQLPSEVPEVLPPVTEEELTKIVEATTPPSPPPPPAPPAPASSSEEPAKPPTGTPPPAPTPAPPPPLPEDVLPPVTDEELRDIVAAPPPPPSKPPSPPPAASEDILPPVTEEELRTIVSGPPPAPTPAPPASTPAPTPISKAPAPSPAPKAPAPSPAAVALAQLPKAQQAAVAQLLQEIFQAPEADLLEMFAELSEEREQKRKERGTQLKSRKA